MERLYGYPHYHIHRADFQLILLNRAQENGVSVEVNTKVMGFEPAKSAKEKDSVVTNHGVRLTADLIIAADGLRSSLKTIVLGEAAESVPVGDSAYRALLPASYLEDPAFDGLDMKGNLTVWLGPDRHVVSYWVKDLEVLNMVIIVPDDNTSEEENWRAQGDVKKMRDAFEGWDWRLRRLLDLVDSSYIWRLRDRNALKTWVHPEGNLALLGDSAHPMLPYAAAGAASAAEDAAALAECLDHVGGDGGRSIKDALRVYEAIRVPRATQMVEQSRANRKLFHMHDGRRHRRA